MNLDTNDMPDHQAIMTRLKKGEEPFAAIESSLSEIAAAVKPLPAMKEKLDAVGELVETYNAVKTGGRFVKWAAGTVAAVGVLLASAKGAFVIK